MKHGTPMQLLVASDATGADLYIMGSITKGSFWSPKKEGDSDAADVAKALANLPGTCSQINVHVNSMGGDVAEGIAIYNALKAHRAHVTTYCEGFACSIASVIFMAGDDRVMRNASLLMIHEAWMTAAGNAKELRKAADDLETVTELSKRAYMEHATDELSREELDRAMREETWVLPEQALAWGLATEVEGPEEEGDEPEQCAMRIAMERLTSEPMQVRVATVETMVPERFADEIAERVFDLISQQQEPAPAEPKNMSFMQRAALMFAE